MLAGLLFVLRLSFVRTEFEPLNELCVGRAYDKFSKKYEWTFDIGDIEKVVQIIGKPIVFSEASVGVVRAYGAREEVKRTVVGGQGEGYTKVLHRSPKLFIVEVVKNKAPFKIRIPSENLAVLWDNLKKYPLNKEVKVTTIQENYCKALGITRFNRESGSFDPKRLYGSRRDYFIIYGSLKVLQVDGVIDYSKTGTVKRLKNEWDSQVKLVG